MANLDQNGIPISPFLKWAGGKRWFAQEHRDLFGIERNRYIEPFLGSGAVFFKVDPSQAILSDINKDLILTYIALRSHPREIERALKKHHRNHSKDYYYTIRSSSPKTDIQRASRFIYLNRTCWNGLYRVNLNGEFNVPIGTKTTVVLPTDDFLGVSQMLQKADIRCCDFEATIDDAEENDLLFIDPPYTILHNTNGFVKYNEAIFSWNDQLRLRDSIRRAIARGAKVILTNANHHSIKNLYEGIGQHRVVSRPSLISGTCRGRGIYEELVIQSL